jgi:NADPH:quinone reductase-like Zn-dependent oxidoreductase
LPLPQKFSFEEGASIPEAYLTAYFNLFLKAKVEKNNNVLVHAGASGVGLAAIQLLKNNCKNIFVTVSNSEKADFCKKLGAIAIIYKNENFKQVIQNKAKEGIQVILDPVGANYLKDNLELLSMDGTLILISLMSGRETTIDLSPVLRKRLKIMGSTLRNLSLEEKSKIVASFKGQKPVPMIDSVFKATQIIEAHKKMEANQNMGKIVLVW